MNETMTEMFEVEDKDIVARIGNRSVWTDWQPNNGRVKPFESLKAGQAWVKQQNNASLKKYRFVKIESIVVKTIVGVR